MKTRHLTTITGPQAEALLNGLDENNCWTYVNKSVPGCPVVEVWSE